MIKEAIGRLVAGQDLTEAEARGVMTAIMDDEVTPAQFGALVTALRLKGETVDEIAGFAGVMREKALAVSIEGMPMVVDTCGTGGDGRGTFNVSTAAAIVVAAAGVPVAKHGNRAASSRCGSADVLDALSVPIILSPDQVSACLREVGIAFMLAPLFHPATRYAVAPRREIGIRTVFNILGPLTNPARVPAQVLGVPTANLVPMMAEVLGRLGSKHALVVSSDDGMDELTVTAPATIAELRDGEVRVSRLDPASLGLKPAPLEALAGGSAEDNAQTMRYLLTGRAHPALVDTVALNAAAALLASDAVETLSDGLDLARDVLSTGKAAAVLEKWTAYQP